MWRISALGTIGASHPKTAQYITVGSRQASPDGTWRQVVIGRTIAHALEHLASQATHRTLQARSVGRTPDSDDGTDEVDPAHQRCYKLTGSASSPK
jgi:hypothetical protein